MRIIPNQIRYPSIKSEQGNSINSLGTTKDQKVSSQFDQLLKERIHSNEQIKFSKHALMRLNSRNIKLTNEQINKIEKGISEADKKGIRDSLVLIDQIALVVNIKNRTVITAVDSTQNEDRIFTNIDGAVII